MDCPHCRYLICPNRESAPLESDRSYNQHLAKQGDVQINRGVLLVRANMDNTMRKVALNELRTIAEVSEVTVTKRILLVKPRANTKPDAVERLIETLSRTTTISK